MTADGTPDFQALNARVIHLEELLTHLDETVRALSGELLAQRKELASLLDQLNLARSELAQALTPPPQPRSLLDEKPPHY